MMENIVGEVTKLEYVLRVISVQEELQALHHMELNAVSRDIACMEL